MQEFVYPAMPEITRVEQVLFRSTDVLDPRVNAEGLVATFIESLLRGYTREQALSVTAQDVFIRTASSVTHRQVLPIIGLISNEPEIAIHRAGLVKNPQWSFYEIYSLGWMKFKDYENR